MLILLFPLVAFAGLFGPNEEEIKKMVSDTILAKYKYCIQEKQKKVEKEKYDKKRESLLLYEIEMCLKYGIDHHKF